MGELIFLIIIGGMGALYLFQTFGYRMPMLDNSGGPALFPQIVCIILLVLVVIRIIQIVSQKEFKKFQFLELFKGSMGFFCIGTVVLVVAMPYLGFLVACFLYLTVEANGLLYLKNGSFGSIGRIIGRELFFVAFVVLLYVFFTHVLFVALPGGILKGLNL